MFLGVLVEQIMWYLAQAMWGEWVAGLSNNKGNSASALVKLGPRLSWEEINGGQKGFL